MTGADWVTLSWYGTGIGKFAVPTRVFVAPPRWWSRLIGDRSLFVRNVA